MAGYETIKNCRFLLPSPNFRISWTWPRCTCCFHLSRARTASTSARRRAVIIGTPRQFPWLTYITLKQAPNLTCQFPPLISSRFHFSLLSFSDRSSCSSLSIKTRGRSGKQPGTHRVKWIISPDCSWKYERISISLGNKDCVARKSDQAEQQENQLRRPRDSKPALSVSSRRFA